MKSGKLIKRPSSNKKCATVKTKPNKLLPKKMTITIVW